VGEPTIDTISAAIDIGKEMSIDMIIGIGGGSALDTAKATAALLTNPGGLMDYLEVVGLGKPLKIPALPIIAIPTTAGTGAEVTRNAVIGIPEQQVKVSLRSPYLLPRVALVDPVLTLSLLPDITAYTGMDALTQLIEPYISSLRNPLTDALCEEGLRRIGQSFIKVYTDGWDVPAREDMSLAALMSGISLANSRLGAVHGLAGPISGMIPAPHGAICASLLPNVMEANLTAILQRSTDDNALIRYAQVGKLLTGKQNASAEASIEWVKEVCSQMHNQPLSKFGLRESYFPSIIDRSQKASSMKGNPVRLFEDELRTILQRSL
jgi:alcohol dehydrogenase class IV